nr:hypothetical protein [Lachnospiraceae bacterium]
DALKALLYQRGLMSVPWGYLSKKSLWKEIRFPEGTEAEDMGTVYRLFMAARRVVVGERVCYHYIQRSGSTIYTTAASRRKAYWRHCREMIARVRKERPACRKAAVSRHFSACAQNLSETSLGERSSFVRRTGSDLQKAAKTVLSDSEARVRNRGAALVALVSPRLLHLMLRGAYCVKKWRIGKKN